MNLTFEKVNTTGIDFGTAFGAKVPGGWLVYVASNAITQSHGVVWRSIQTQVTSGREFQTDPLPANR